MGTHHEYRTRPRDQRVADLEDKTAELERQLSDARDSLAAEVAAAAFSEHSFQPGYDDYEPDDGEFPGRRFQPPAFDDGYDGPAGGYDDETELFGPDDQVAEDPDDGLELAAPRTAQFPRERRGPTYREPAPARPAVARSSTGSARPRTEQLVNQGRGSTRARRRLPHLMTRNHKLIGGAVAAVALITVIVVVLTTGGAGWPASVAGVQTEAAQACTNTNVMAEPTQINFACAKQTRQVLWVFSLLTSNNNPAYDSTSNGRVGLEPIAPAQGGEVAWTLNLHHPYDARNAVDSLQVAARAINNIVGGATLTGIGGKLVVDPGLESSAANCERYTGSKALRQRTGYPALCARPLTIPDGQDALVSDIYGKWVVGATSQQAQDAATLFEYANDPGNPQVQTVLKRIEPAHS